MSLSLPALVLVWVFGMGLVGMSKDNFEMSQTWIVLSLVGWVILMAVSWFLIRPAITDTSEAATKRFSAGIGVTHLLMIVILFLMVFKPGAPAGLLISRPPARSVPRQRHDGDDPQVRHDEEQRGGRPTLPGLAGPRRAPA